MNTINRILICCTFIFILSFALFPLKGNETAKAARNDFQNLKENFVFFFEDTVNHSDYNKQKSNNPINISSKFSNEKAKNLQLYLMVMLAAIISGVSARIIFIKKYPLKKEKDENNYTEEFSVDFCMNLSNELKTSITIIHELIDSLQNNIEKENNIRAEINLDIISRETENLQLHCDEILSSLSLKQQNNFIKIVHDDIVSFTAKFFDTLMERNSWYKNIELRFLPSEYDIWMDFSPDYMRIILQNIIHDALERCKSHNRIEIRISKNESENLCHIYISDNAKSGLGESTVITKSREFAKKNDSMIMDNSNIKLFLAKQLIEKVGGLLQVKSLSNESTTIELSLPITHQAQLSKINVIDINDYRKIPIYEEIRKPQLLALTENLQKFRYLTSTLNHYFDLVLANNEREAFKLIDIRRPECMLIEMQASNIDGFAITKKIKESKSTYMIPIIIISTRSLSEDRLQAFECGADAFISQPFSNEELVMLIEKLINNRKKINYKTNFKKEEDNYTSKLSDNISKKTDNQFIEQITNIIYRECGKSDNLLALLSSEICLSQSQLNRRIKAETGFSTSGYILKVRLNKAKMILSKSSKPIGEIAVECGFNDFAYFSHTFKKEFGMTPTCYQRLPNGTN
jgi:AraC-like DNA-binding protein/CheY-like chemotaxis protein